jgi:hypothetical protein
MSLKRIDTPHGRAYAYGSGTDALLMPSVTTILSFEPSPYLEELEAKIGKEQLKVISERAAFRGTAMHRFLENLFICLQRTGDFDKSLLYTQKKTPGDLRADGIAEDRISWGRDLFYNYIHEGVFDQIKRVAFTERFMWSLQHKFAGTADFGFYNYEDSLIISDFKSASGHRGEDVISKYKKQGAAYVIACEEINKRPIKNFQVWVSSPEGMQIEILEGAELLQKKSEFIDLCERFHSAWDVKPIREYYINNYLNGQK